MGRHSSLPRYTPVRGNAKYFFLLSVWVFNSWFLQMSNLSSCQLLHMHQTYWGHLAIGSRPSFSHVDTRPNLKQLRIASSQDDLVIWYQFGSNALLEVSFMPRASIPAPLWYSVPISTEMTTNWENPSYDNTEMFMTTTSRIAQFGDQSSLGPWDSWPYSHLHPQWHRSGHWTVRYLRCHLWSLEKCQEKMLEIKKNAVNFIF